jgi:hypothetical protein
MISRQFPQPSPVLSGSPGVLIVPQAMAIGTAVDLVVMIWAASEAEEWANRICRIPL